MTPIRTVGVIGAGAWGTALAQVCARAGLEVWLQSHDPQVAAVLATTRENKTYLPGVRIEDAVQPTADLADLAGADIILAAAPAQFARSTLTAFAPYARPGLPVVLCAKGVEQGSMKLMTEVLAETAPQARPAVLSGPGFAAEVGRALPCAVTLACPDPALGEAIAAAIATPMFRPYFAPDLIGAEVGGAVKNVLAIACGVVEGAGLGRSAHAGLVTRGFAEMIRIAVALGGLPDTLSGLCGLGDLVLTCSSPQSRNMSVGVAIGAGTTLNVVQAGKLALAEGVTTAPALRQLNRRLGVNAPICDAVAAIVLDELSIGQAVEGLLARPLKSEHW